MAGPWEKYQSPQGASGPWDKYNAKPPSGPSAEELTAGGATPRLLRRQGLSEPPPPPSFTEKSLPALPFLGGAVGGMVGNVPGAALGGIAGKAVQSALEAKSATEGGETIKSPNTEDMAWEGIKQGAYELGGRLLTAIPGRLFAPLKGPIEQPTETIAGVKIPQTVGQESGKARGFTQQIEHYLSSTFLGGPLQKIRALQEEGSRQVMAKLSQVGMAEPENLAKNWAMARETTRNAAQPLYQSLEGIPATPELSKAATDILADETLRLPPKVRQALSTASEGTGGKVLDQTAQNLGYANAKEAEKKLGQKTWQSLLDEQAATSQSGATVKGALDARKEIGALASATRDKSEARLLWQAHSSLDEAINGILTPEQLVAKKQADLLWRRSYIMDDVAQGLEKMENVQDPQAAAAIVPKAFVKMVNKLGREPVARVEGEVVSKASKLDVLFDNPQDQQAMKDLASFLNNKYSTLQGSSGISESIARIGVALEALHIPISLGVGIATGHPVAGAVSAGAAGLQLSAMYAISKVLAEPGGARLLRQYFMSPAARQTALATRILGTALEASRPPAGSPPLPPRPSSGSDGMSPPPPGAMDIPNQWPPIR